MKVKIKVPETWADIKLSQYQKYLRVTKDLDVEKDIKTINKRIVGVFCNLPDNVVNAMSYNSFNECLKAVTDLISADTSKIEFKRIFTKNYVDYGFIPNMDKMTVGEVADLDEFLKDWQKMDKAMAILFRKVKTRHRDKYSIEKYTGKEKPLDLSMDKVLGANFFLISLFKDLANCIPNFIEAQIVNQKLEILEENGVGIKQYMDYVREIFLNIDKHLNLISTQQ